MTKFNEELKGLLQNCTCPSKESCDCEVIEKICIRFTSAQIQEVREETEKIENPHKYSDGVEMAPDFGIFEDARDRFLAILNKKFLI